MSRESAGSITIDANVRCMRIYPMERTKKRVSDLKTVGIKLNRDQSIQLARVLLAAAQEWDDIEVTAYRFDKRKADNTYHITVTSMRPEDE